MNQPKRLQSVIIPYKIKNGKVFVFLQKRSATAKRAPNKIGFFGGHIEPGETKEQALVREIKEELNYSLQEYKFLDSFEFARSIRITFYMKAPDDFEDKIEVLEGDYGKYFSEEEAEKEPNIIEEDRTVLKRFFEEIKKL